MDIKHHTEPEKLERYSFLWSEARLLVAAVSLFFGASPIAYSLFGMYGLYTIVRGLLTISWLLSGAASGYLLYQWFQNDKKVFGTKALTETTAFLVSAISGINLGFVGLTGQNIGMFFFTSYFVFKLTAIMYIVLAIYLYTRWAAHHQKLFS